MVHAAAIDVCEKTERWRPALALLGDAAATSLANLVTYTASLSACVKGTKWEAAGYLYGTLEDCSVQGNLMTHTAAINACAKGWSWEEAIHLLGTCGPMDALAVSAAMDAGVKAMQWSQVLWMFRSFQQTDASRSLELYEPWLKYTFLAKMMLRFGMCQSLVSRRLGGYCKDLLDLQRPVKTE